MQKILYNRLLLPSVLDGTKPMTRREAYNGEISNPNLGICLEGKDKGKAYLCDGECVMAKSKYAIGEVVAIAQSYEDCGMMYDAFGGEVGWHNPMFVKADFMPHQIQFTDIKVERLQDISDEDCLKEGVVYHKDDTPFNYYFRDNSDMGIWNSFPTPQEAFQFILKKCCKPRNLWEINPWVFAYTFKLVK